MLAEAVGETSQLKGTAPRPCAKTDDPAHGVGDRAWLPPPSRDPAWCAFTGDRAYFPRVIARGKRTNLPALSRDGNGLMSSRRRYTRRWGIEHRQDLRVHALFCVAGAGSLKTLNAHAPATRLTRHVAGGTA